MESNSAAASGAASPKKSLEFQTSAVSKTVANKVSDAPLCEIDPRCKEVSISFCSNKNYRGCALAYCQDHSGEARKRSNTCLCLDTDRYEDVCCECAQDQITAKQRFTNVCLILSVVIFLLTLCATRWILSSTLLK